jgi:hypothetical protein
MGSITLKELQAVFPPPLPSYTPNEQARNLVRNLITVEVSCVLPLACCPIATSCHSKYVSPPIVLVTTIKIFYSC